MIALFIIAGVVGYLIAALVCARISAVHGGPSAAEWTSADTGFALLCGICWPLVVLILVSVWLFDRLTALVCPEVGRLRRAEKRASDLRYRAGELHRSALLVEGTDAFDALEQMAADLRKRADEVEPTPSRMGRR